MVIVHYLSHGEFPQGPMAPVDLEEKIEKNPPGGLFEKRWREKCGRFR
jgi:hypothetical protein